MSDIISFWLAKDNLREEKARRVLKAWYEEGYSVRYVITEALLKLHDPDPEFIEDNPIPELNAVLNQVNKLLEQIGNRGYSLFPRRDENTPQSGWRIALFYQSRNRQNLA